MPEGLLLQAFSSRRRPNLPGRCQPSTFGAKRLNFCVRDGYRWCPLAIVTGMLRVRAFALLPWLDLRLALPASLRAAAFAFAPSKPHSGKLTCKVFSVFLSLALGFRFPLAFSLTASDQAVDLLVSASSRIAPLSPPTYLLIVSQGSSYLRTGIFFLRWASRLDAFSVYPLRISLPSCAVGTTTVAPGMRPLRSSRTRSSSSHDSFAHDG